MSYLNALGEPVPGRDTVISPPDDVQKYADYMRKRCESQPIVAEDWPPRVGQDFFGRLALVEKQDSNKTSNSAWYQLRGQVDKVIDASGNREISVEDILKPVSDTALSLRIVIDGPPGIGKTTLCHKLLNMWSIGTLPHCQHHLVLYCPLRNENIAKATTLADLFECQRHEVPKVIEWFEEKNGEGLLIIFDGWDELSTHLRKSSMAFNVIHRNKLDQCSVIVTSRSYASSSLLKVSCIKHVQVIGFTQAEIFEVIIQTLQEDPQLAKELIEAYKKEESNVEWQDFNLMSYVELLGNALTLGSFGVENDNTVYWEKLLKNKDSKLAVKLINDLKIRGDVQSLCYIPLVCSMVILVYRKKGHLPATLSQLYENFILQAIRRQVKKQGTYDPYALESLSSLPLQLLERIQKLCKLAYINLANTRITFSLHQLQDQSLSEVDFFGLVTTFTEYDEKKYQFLHLSIQEFLAAWWIAKHENTENIFKKQFHNDHFRMCLRFVAGLTHLKHKSYERYFNEQFDLQCKLSHDGDDALFNFFYYNPEIMNYHYQYNIITECDEKFPILLLQLLYESQNVALCHILATSFNQSSLCLKREMLSQFDWLCFSFFLSNSSITWNHLHFIKLLNQNESLIFTDGLANGSLQTKCRRLEIAFNEPTNDLLLNFLQSSFVSNIQECYCHLEKGVYFLSLALLHFLKLPHIKILHLTCEAVDNSFSTDQCFEIEKCIQEKSTLEELEIFCHLGCGTDIITSVIKGVTRNKKITSFIIELVYSDLSPPPPISGEVLEQLLKDNYTLKALSLIIPNELLQTWPPFMEKNTPLTALEIRVNMGHNLLATSFLSQIEELNSLIELLITFPYSPVQFIFVPNLQSLISPKTRAKSAMVIHATLEIGSLKVYVTFNNGIATCNGFFDIYSISPPSKEIVQVVLKALGNNCIQFSNQLMFF